MSSRSSACVMLRELSIERPDWLFRADPQAICIGTARGLPEQPRDDCCAIMSLPIRRA